MKVIIVDDEKPMLLIMEKMISSIPGIEITGVFESAPDAFEFIRQNRVDMVFADIKMPEECGLDFARRIASEFPDIDIVFVTSYDQYAMDAFEVYAFDYMVKPVSRERLENTVKRALQRHAHTLQFRRENDNGKLSVYCLGGLKIQYMDGTRVHLSSSKSAEMLSYLIAHKGKYVSKWSILEDIFSGMPAQNAETYLNTTIYKLRKSLERFGLKEIIISSSEGYTIEIQDVYIDFIDFENRVNALSIIDKSNIEQALKTENMYDGEFFGDKVYLWSLFEKERLSGIYTGFAKKFGKYLLENDNIDAALQILRKLSHKNELDEEVNCLLMRAYAAGRDRASLMRQYERYADALKRELKATPGKRAAELYAALIKSLQ